MSARFDRYATESEVMTLDQLIEETDFEVDWTPLHGKHEDGDPIEIPEDFARGLYRKDTSQILGIHGKRYAIRKYPAVLEQFRNALRILDIPGAGSGADFIKEAECRVGWAKDGARYKARITMPWEVDIPHRGRKVGDVVRGELILKDSYDGGWSSGMGFGLLRLKCTNGQTALEEILAYSARHTRGAEEIVVDADKLKWAFDVMNKHFNVFGKAATALAGIPITREQATLFFQSRWMFGMPLEVAESKDIVAQRTLHMEKKERNEDTDGRLPPLPFNQARVRDLMTSFQDTLEEYEDEPTVFTIHNALTRWGSHWPVKGSADPTIAADARDSRIYRTNRMLLNQEPASAFTELILLKSPAYQARYRDAGFDPEFAIAA